MRLIPPQPPSILRRVYDQSGSSVRSKSDQLDSSNQTPILEAALIEGEPPPPIYDAVAVRINGDGINQAGPPWWRRHQRFIILVTLLFVAALIAIVGESLLSRSDDEPPPPRETEQPGESRTEAPTQMPTPTQYQIRFNIQYAISSECGITAYDVLNDNYGITIKEGLINATESILLDILNSKYPQDHAQRRSLVYYNPLNPIIITKVEDIVDQKCPFGINCRRCYQRSM